MGASAALILHVYVVKIACSTYSVRVSKSRDRLSSADGCAKALNGDTVAAKALMEHAEAKKLEFSGDEEKPIQIEGKVEVSVFKEVVKETLEEY